MLYLRLQHLLASPGFEPGSSVSLNRGFHWAQDQFGAKPLPQTAVLYPANTQGVLETHMNTTSYGGNYLVLWTTLYLDIVQDVVRLSFSFLVSSLGDPRRLNPLQYLMECLTKLTLKIQNECTVKKNILPRSIANIQRHSPLHLRFCCPTLWTMPPTCKTAWNLSRPLLEAAGHQTKQEFLYH